MEDHKIVQHLRILSDKEWNRFFFFAKGRIRKEEKFSVLAYLMKTVDENIVYDMAHIRTLKPEGDLSKLFNQFVELTEDFLAMEELGMQQNSLLKSILLIKRLRNNGPENLLLQAIKKAKRAMANCTENGLMFFHLRRWLIDESFFHPALEDFLRDSEKMEDLEVYFCLIILHHACRELANKRLNLTTDQPPLLDEALRLCDDPRTKKIPLLHIYSLGVQLFTSFGDDKYLEFKELILDEMNLLEDNEQSFLFKLLIIHTAHAVRANHAHLETSLEVYRFGITHKLLEDGGFLIKEHFMNYINIACSIGRIRTAKLFLEENKENLHEKDKDRVVNVSLSRIYMLEGEFKKAFRLLTKNRFKGSLWFTGHTCRLMACYDWDASGRLMRLKGKDVFLKEEVTAFNRGWKDQRKKLGASNELIIANHHFYLMVRELVYPQKKISLDAYKRQLTQQLEGYDLIACRGWLRKKIEEL